MSQDFLYKAILGSIVSEKSTRIGEKNNQYIFRVVPEATKEDVKAAVQLLFKVKVKGVQMLNLRANRNATVVSPANAMTFARLMFA